MSNNICSVCMRRFSEHSLQQVKECTEQFALVELERQANGECISCGDSADIQDINGTYFCHGCLMWLTQLNDGS